MDRLTAQDPHRIGQYRLLGRLGQGGMGQVYLARSERGRTVAVKTIKRELAQETDFRRRFALEIAAAQRVGGQWTAPVLDSDTEAVTPWVATGYIAGPSLHEVVSRDFGALPERSVSLLANGLAHALTDIHAADLVHRDLKPSNVLLTIDGPRVIDFGIARALDANHGGLTRTGATIGSPGFMSPEQVRGQRVTPASDVFCLGSLLAYAATGRTPFGALDTSVHLLLFRVAEEEPDLTGIPEGLRHVISGCLRQDPEQRFTLPELLSLTTPDGSREPWLPGPLVAQLGRHAVELLDSESPESRTDHRAVAASPPQPAAPAPAWPGLHPSAQQRPVPLPSPYSMPNTAHHPPPTPAPIPAPSMPSMGGFGPAGYGPATSTGATGGGNNARRWAFASLGAAFVVLAVVVGLVIRGSGGGSTSIDEEYLGAWQGRYEPESGLDKLLRFEISQGEEGDIVGTATTITDEVLCSFQVRLESFDQRLEFTELHDWSVPEGEVNESCRDNATPQTLELSANGDELTWTYNDQQATLRRADATGEANVPEDLVGTYRYEWDNDDGSGTSEITVTQGAIGDVVMTFHQTTDTYECTWENRLVQVTEDEVIMGPDTLVGDGNSADCWTDGGFRMWTDGPEGALNIAWLADPDGDQGRYPRAD
ncbi:serine/threonine-protein kinase [Streptomyces millisiae]|uniref:Serine/threonine-protein kinase n=1 Tax=Streptomyces millisiae TaxID=3075542 RepID=A0ABU2M0I4_9ACTN|nr:serine/threonine-protein kinase [Streptomyces sp. DSM 44918]MDT0323366.1 serine/threonine-protein kinase [Streptomyces sp. DSM 44918]